MKIAFATCSAIPQGGDDDQDAAGLLDADFRVWDDASTDWSDYDRVILRSVWDYSWRHHQFLDWCRSVGPARLRNPPEMVAFNLDKRYLADLAVRSVSTTYVNVGDALPGFDHEVVVKPNISAGARDTGRFASLSAAVELIERIHASGRIALVQPYLPAVDERGETSVVFIGGEVSHVLTKRAVLRREGVAPVAEGKLRVAAAMLEEDLVAPGAADEEQMSLAGDVHDEISDRFGTPLYARVDLIRDGAGEPSVSEVELIEPRLYLGFADGSARRLADAVLAS